ncbi:MAG: hypothetical protein OEV91_03725 [Desulfobulbaceae bacterium]|nr:hypothetical protein [Desulfobulbaceae bacterium]
MAENIDDITINYEDEEGTQLIKEIDKDILSRGSWCTIIFLYQELDRKTGEFGESKVSIRRYKKTGGVYRQQSKFNISGQKQGLQISETLSKWFT